MSDISNQLIKDSYDYVLQSDLSSGTVYRIGGSIPVNPKFLSGLTINDSFTYSNGTEQLGYALLTDGTGYAYWGPVSAATPSSGVTSITVGNGLSANSSTGAVTIVFTGSTSTSGDYLPLSGGTVTGGTVFNSGLTANTISATTYLNLPVTADTFVTGFTLNNDIITLTQNRTDSFSSFTLSLSAYTGGGLTYYVTGSTPSGSTFISGDRWFNTTNGDELVYINDGDSQQWIQICCGSGGGGGGSSTIQGITGITGTSGVSASTTDYGTTIINTDPDQTVVITGGTNIQIVSAYPNFGVNFTGTTGSNFTGGTVTGGTIFQSGLTANTISASTYFNLPITGITSGTGISVTSTGGGGYQITNTSPDQTVTISGGTGITTGGTYPNFTLVNSLPDQTVVITGGTNIQIVSAYPNFGVNFTGTTGSNFTGGTVSGATNFTNGLTANTISASTYFNLPSSFQSARINNTTQFSADTGNFINFSGINITITSAGTNTLVFSAATGGSSSIGVTQIIPGTGISISPTGGTGNVRINSTTLVASSSCVLVPDSTIYIGGSTYGWNDRTWDLNDTSFGTANINCGVPLPIDALGNSVISICGIAYINDSDPVGHKLDFSVHLNVFDCTNVDRGGLKPLTSSTITDAFNSAGIYCFNLSYVVPRLEPLYSCTNFIVAGFSSDSVDGTELRISYTIKIT